MLFEVLNDSFTTHTAALWCLAVVSQALRPRKGKTRYLSSFGLKPIGETIIWKGVTWARWEQIRSAWSRGGMAAALSLSLSLFLPSLLTSAVFHLNNACGPRKSSLRRMPRGASSMGAFWVKAEQNPSEGTSASLEQQTPSLLISWL